MLRILVRATRASTRSNGTYDRVSQRASAIEAAEGVAVEIRRDGNPDQRQDRRGDAEGAGPAHIITSLRFRSRRARGAAFPLKGRRVKPMPIAEANRLGSLAEFRRGDPGEARARDVRARQHPPAGLTVAAVESARMRVAVDIAPSG